MVLVSTREKNRSRKHIKRESEKRGKKDPEWTIGPCLELVRSPGMMMSGQGKSKHYIFCSGHPDEAKLHNYYFIKTSDLRRILRKLYLKIECDSFY